MLLLTILQKIIPNDLSLEYYRKKTETEAVPDDELQQFLNFMKVEIQIQERLMSDAAMKQKVPSTRDCHETPSASALAVSGGEVLCIFCDQNRHTANSCITALFMDKKKAVM